MDDRFVITSDAEVASDAQARIDGSAGRTFQVIALRAGMIDAALRIRNMSAGGLMAETDHVFAVGERLAIDLPVIGRMGARVAWVRADRIGLAFDHPVDPRKACAGVA